VTKFDPKAFTEMLLEDYQGSFKHPNKSGKMRGSSRIKPIGSMKSSRERGAFQRSGSVPLSTHQKAHRSDYKTALKQQLGHQKHPEAMAQTNVSDGGRSYSVPNKDNTGITRETNPIRANKKYNKAVQRSRKANPGRKEWEQKQSFNHYVKNKISRNTARDVAKVRQAPEVEPKRQLRSPELNQRKEIRNLPETEPRRGVSRLPPKGR